MIVENFGQEVLYVLTNEGLTPQISIPALRFHNRLDNVTPVEDSRAIARVWKNARLVETDGLGHRGALQSEATVEQVLRFLGNQRID